MPAIVNAGHGAAVTCWPTCQSLRAASARLITTLPAVIVQLPAVICRWAQTSVRQTRAGFSFKALKNAVDSMSSIGARRMRPRVAASGTAELISLVTMVANGASCPATSPCCTTSSPRSTTGAAAKLSRRIDVWAAV